MIKSHSVVIQSRTTITGTEGEHTYTFATFKTIVADIQPAQLSAIQIEAWGLTDLAAYAKKMFYDRDNTILLTMRAVVDGETYEIRAINLWPNHGEAILTPVQGI
jgi:hypothetical protein